MILPNLLTYDRNRKKEKAAAKVEPKTNSPKRLRVVIMYLSD